MISSAHILGEILAWCKFDQNRFIGLDARYGYGHTDRYTCTDTFLKHIFDFKAPQSGYIHRKRKLYSGTTPTVYILPLFCIITGTSCEVRLLLTDRCDYNDGVEEGALQGPLQRGDVLGAVPTTVAHRHHQLVLEQVQTVHHQARPVILVQNQGVPSHRPQVVRHVLPDNLDALLHLQENSEG